MNLDELRLIATTIVSEKKPSVNIVPEQWGAMLDFAQLKHYKRKLGLPEEYVPGRPKPSQSYAINQRIDDDLAPFSVHMGRTGELPFPISQQGESTLPPDFFFPTGMLYNMIKPSGEVAPREVYLLTDEEWVEYVTSQIIEQTFDYPIANIKSGYIRFLPKNLGHIEFTYLRRPVKPVFGYTTADGYIAYNSATSTELEWDELNQVDILYILLSDMGIVIERGDIFQVSEKVKAQGI